MPIRHRDGERGTPGARSPVPSIAPAVLPVFEDTDPSLGGPRGGFPPHHGKPRIRDRDEPKLEPGSTSRGKHKRK